LTFGSRSSGSGSGSGRGRASCLEAARHCGHAWQSMLGPLWPRGGRARGRPGPIGCPTTTSTAWLPALPPLSDSYTQTNLSKSSEIEIRKACVSGALSVRQGNSHKNPRNRKRNATARTWEFRRTPRMHCHLSERGLPQVMKSDDLRKRKQALEEEERVRWGSHHT
jgi:hypothetical protein